MYIVDFERSEVVNMDNVNSIALGNKTKSNEIIANMNNGDIIILGVYDDSERACEVFDMLLAYCFPPSIYSMNNCNLGKDEIKKVTMEIEPLLVSSIGNTKIERFDSGVYYMPEM